MLEVNVNKLDNWLGGICWNCVCNWRELFVMTFGVIILSIGLIIMGIRDKIR